MKQYIILLRPVNFVITGASVYVACLLAGGVRTQFLFMFFASIGAALIAGGGMVLNDIFDIEIDTINKPLRPLPSGSITKLDALLFYFGLTGVGLIMSAYTTLLALLIAVAAAAVIFLYSYKLKSTPLLGNLTVGFLTAMAFVYGGVVVGNVHKALVPALFAFFINVGREIIKDMEDVDGDAQHNAMTFPVMYGIKKTCIVATLFLSAVIVSTMVPYAIGMYSFKYFIIVSIGVNSVVAYVMYSVWKDQSVKNFHLLSTILKWDMVVGLIAIYVG